VCGDIPDPIARALNGLIEEVTSLRAQIVAIEHAQQAASVVEPTIPGEVPALRLVASGGNSADDGSARAS
jgi:hypothetical protein